MLILNLVWFGHKGAKLRGGQNPLLWSERVFEIPVRVGLKLRDGDGHDRVNVTRYEHDVDNVNDDDFYILNKNELMIEARHVQLKNISQP